MFLHSIFVIYTTNQQGRKVIYLHHRIDIFVFRKCIENWKKMYLTDIDDDDDDKLIGLE